MKSRVAPGIGPWPSPCSRGAAVPACLGVAAQGRYTATGMEGPGPFGASPRWRRARSTTPTHSAARRFPATPASVGQARRFLLGRAARCQLRTRRTSWCLMLSELATNAVQHAATEFEVSVTGGARRPRPCASRSATAPPATRHRRSRSRTRRTGAACTSCATLADAWGIEMRRDRPGKTVWFTLPLSGGGPVPAGGAGGTGRVGRRTRRCERRGDGRGGRGGGGGGAASATGAEADWPAMSGTDGRPAWPVRACGPCSTGCATRSWPPTSAA